ncbi:unnamed protein product [Durusdinium trenchii]
MVTKEDCGGADPQAWISPSWASRGYHVLCLASECPSGTGDEHCSASGPVAKVCWGGVQDDCEELTGLASVLREEGLNSLVSLQDLLVVQRSVLNQERYEKLLQARLKHNKPPLNFAFYAVEGDGMPPRKLESLQGQSGMILAFEGGTFVWPGIQLGYRRNVTLQPRNEASIELQIETRSLQPLVVEISSFLDENDCQHIIDKALPHIRKSSVKHMDQDVGKPDSNWRTSSTYFMPSDDAVLRRIDDRVSALTLIKKTHQELAQILRYEQGEQYVAHHDYFDPEMYAQNRDIQEMIKRGLFNRLATVFFYLTDVEEGGETNFPRADGLPQPHDFGDCSRGISVYPRRGRIIIFYSQHPSAEADEYSLHGGCQVKRGVKWSANKWIWNKPMDYIQE